jgi:Protein of unknown function (DUF2914)/Tetratricopeptide repeat
MLETREPRSVVEAAEQAAAAGDYASAEQLLREAARLQEASLGSLHPDLANTLNNLGVVCEITEKPVDAEHFFRRACAIATAVLEPDHPFVATSRKNLEEFCAARGRAIGSSAASSIADDRNAPATASDAIPPVFPSYQESRPVASRRWPRGLAIGALIAGGLFLGFIATRTWLGSTDEVGSSPGSPSVSPGSPTTTAASSPVEPIAPDASKETGAKTSVTVSTPPGRRVRESPSLPSAAAESRKTAAPVPQPPVVAFAQLCRDLSTARPRGSSTDWHCVPPGLPVGPGPLFFYTRLKSPTATTVQHRWYRHDRLRQVVELPIRANPTGGYRTYSRNTVDNQGAGDWRVELRTRDGVLLHEERFVVR